MAVGETARLIASLELQDKFSGQMKGAIGTLGTAESKLGRTSGAMGILRTSSGKLGGAFSHLKGQISGLLGAAGLVGLGGGLLSVIGLLKGGIDRATELGDVSKRLAGLTGETTAAMSGLSAGLSHFGIDTDTQTKIVGMLEKNLGNLATGGGAQAAKLVKDFGFSVLDSSGKVKSAQQIISDFTDVFNNDAIPASQKAALAQKLFGKSWQDLLPVLQAGKGGLQAATDEAAQFGETLTTDDVKALDAAREASRKWHTALSGLETQIGLAVLPLVTDLATAATDFLKDPNNRKSLIGFFKQGVDLAKKFGGFLKDTVIPNISNLVGAAKGFWDNLPGPLRDLIVTGFAADRTIKFAFGFSLADVGKDVLSTVIKGIGGEFFNRGSPVNPMWVVTEGGFGGGLPGSGAAGGGLSALLTGGAAIALAFVSIKAIVDPIVTAVHGLIGGPDIPASDGKPTLSTNPVAPNNAIGWMFTPDGIKWLRDHPAGATGSGVYNQPPTPAYVTLSPKTMTSLQTWLTTPNGREDRTGAPGTASGSGAVQGMLGNVLPGLKGIFDTNNDNLVTLREVVASKLGLSVQTLTALKTASGGWNAKLAAKLGISNANLQSIVGTSRGTVTAVKNLKLDPTIKVNTTVNTTFNVSARTIAQQVERYFSTSHNRMGSTAT